MIEKKWRVAVNAPLLEPLIYISNPKFEKDLAPGLSVLVPLGKRLVHGILIEEAPDGEESFKIKMIQDLAMDRLALTKAQVKWCQFLSDYYVHPIGQIFDTFFPPLKRFSKQKPRKKGPIPHFDEIEEWSKAPHLTHEQETIVKTFENHRKGFRPHLIFGVTGSGKTEVYIQLIQQALQRNQKALFLVPEISLTPQLLQRITARFPNQMAVLHSQLTEREKTDQWWRCVDGEASILLGARSALFCPVPNLGLIIVDEEHESSFKQDEKLKYHARDAAVMRAKFENCPVVLGSATPSLESWNNVLQKKYDLHTLKHRVANRPLPVIEVVDMRIEREQRNEQIWNERIPSWLSAKLFEEIKLNYENHEQVALFLNRRGTAQAVIGKVTNEVPQCPNCDISLTLHGKTYLLCHYCNYSASIQEMEKEMGEEELRPMGIGTELIEKDLQALFPSARIARADRDEIHNREEMEELIRKVEKREVDFLVGTQMIAKGLDFPSLTLVGLILADVSFNLPDFRACEKSFQLLSQVSGRPGRHLKPGRVIVQTLNPMHPSLSFVEKHDFLSFAEFELEFRKNLSYPPAWKLAAVRFQGLDQRRVEDVALALGRWAHEVTQSNPSFLGVQVLGPARAPLSKLRNLYRFQLLIKADHHAKIKRLCKAMLNKSRVMAKGVRIIVDIDPQNLM